VVAERKKRTMAINFAKPGKNSGKNAETKGISNSKGKGKRAVSGTRKVSPSKKSIKKA
jgi:hypothetical protein